MTIKGKGVKYHELLERLKSLEVENEVLASRAEEVLLLSILGDTIATLETEKDLVEELLEKIAILKDIPFCACYSKNNDDYTLVSSYGSGSYSELVRDTFRLGDRIVKTLEDEGSYCGPVESTVINCSPVAEKTEVLVLCFASNWINEGIFVFLNEKNAESLESKLLVIKQAVRMVMGKIENLSYINQIEVLNRQLEQRVQARTVELTAANQRLREEINERKQIESELIDAKNKAQESDRLKSAFLANMSHEIRTPMNAIVGFSEIIESVDCHQDEMKLYLRLIHSNSLSLSNLINDLLDFSKIESNQLRLHCSSFNIKDTLEEIRLMGDSLLKLYEKNNINIKVHCDIKSAEANVFSDEFRLKQILNNLLSNAVKFSFKGTVLIKGKIKNEHVCFSVIDEGIGIDKSQHELIFRRFGRISDDVNKTIAGNGLGLTITKNLVEMLGGKINVRSEIGKGATFNFSIPRHKHS